MAVGNTRNWKDPSENVEALSLASNKRQDDLRDANNKLVDCRFDCLKEMMELHVCHLKEMNRAESRRVDEQAQLRSDYAIRLSDAEAKRIDAIRAVDVNAVSVDRAKASDQATVLAGQVSSTAEALRNLVATTANTIAQSNQAANAALSTRITTLEQAQYKGEGKGLGIGASWGVFLAVATLIVAGVIGFISLTRGAVVAPAPQVIYVPSPAGAPPVVNAPATVAPPNTPRSP